MRFKSLSSTARSLLLVGALVGAGCASDVGLLGLYTTGEGTSDKEVYLRLESELDGRGCSVRRHGKISGARGPLELSDVNRFVLVQCDSGSGEPLLGHTVLRQLGAASIPSRDGERGNIVWIAGALADSSDLATETDSDRAYTIKLSRFGDTPGTEREHEEAAINADAAQRENPFRSEAAIDVAVSVGMDEVDQVVVIYYESAAAAKAFRAANGDVLKRIGQFNKTHLADYTYLSISVEP